ncbi:MAG: hypothetical protein PVG14_06860 [Anaerolineales bacterium]|jgi:hypothetical protein
MDVGMLWFDNDSKSDLPSKITRAASYYNKKYGVKPNLCYVNPKTVSNGHAKEGFKQIEAKSGGIELRTTELVLPNHFWIGINGKNNHPEE